MDRGTQQGSETMVELSADYTKMRKGTKIRGSVTVIDYCPECGRKGARTIYRRDGFTTYVHKSTFGSLFETVTDHCTIRTD